MDFITRKIVEPVMGVLKSGISADSVADALAWGVVCGLFPIPGATSGASMVVTYAFSLNIVCVMAANLAATPLNLASFVSIIRTGEWLLSLPPTPIAMQPFKDDFLAALSTFWMSLAAGVLVWALAAYPSAFVLSRLFRPITRKLSPPPKDLEEEDPSLNKTL